MKVLDIIAGICLVLGLFIFAMNKNMYGLLSFNTLNLVGCACFSIQKRFDKKKTIE